jgi:hypothetical protein
MSLKLNSSGGGSVTLQEPSTATNGTLTLPAGTGTVAVNGLSSNIVSGTAVAATSGTNIDFTGIPSWVKRITLVANDISFAAAGTSRIRIGTSGGLVSTGYSSTNGTISNANTTVVSNITDGFPGPITGSAAATATIVCTVFNVTGNTWTAMTQAIRPTDLLTQNGVGFIALSGTLDRISIVATTSTFDAGTINILYE